MWVLGALRDSIFVLEGLLEQQTRLNPVEIRIDTGGTSDSICRCQAYGYVQPLLCSLFFREELKKGKAGINLSDRVYRR